MRLDEEAAEKRKSHVYFVVPGVKDFYSDQVGSVELDPGIAKSIQVLNSKGYMTVASCSGHMTNKGDNIPGAGYIWLKVFPDSTSRMPKGLRKGTVKTGGIAIRWRGRSIENLETLWKRLEDWAVSLPAVKQEAA